MAQTLYALDPTGCGPNTLRIGNPTVCPSPPTPPPTPGLTPTFAGPQEHVYYEEAYAYDDAEGVRRIGTREEAEAHSARVYAQVTTAPVMAVAITAPTSSAQRTAPLSSLVTTDDE